jgi:hypothetical protein
VQWRTTLSRDGSAVGILRKAHPAQATAHRKISTRSRAKLPEGVLLLTAIDPPNFVAAGPIPTSIAAAV